MKPGLFLGVIAINARHNLLHIVVGALGVQASRDATSSRQYMGFSAPSSVCSLSPFGRNSGLIEMSI